MSIPEKTMTSPTQTIRDAPHFDLPRSLLLGTGVTCGVLAAMTVQILLARAGFDLATLWHDVIAGQALQMRAVGGWWAVAGAAFLVGAAVSAALSRLPLPWRRLRLLRWLLGMAIVFALAQAGHEAALIEVHSAGLQAAATLVALALAALLALFGAYFTLRR